MKIRDLDLIPISGDNYLVIGCDSCGGIGQKEMDEVKAPYSIVGAFTLRVALMEVIVSGAEIIGVVDTLNTSMEDGGRELIEGIKDELKRSSINLPVFTGSTEENFRTLQTGLGITVIGMVHKDRLRLCKASKGDVIAIVGKPKVGSEVLEDKGEIIDINDIKTLLSTDGVNEIVPVGSKGILYEIESLCNSVSLNYTLDKGSSLDIKRSGGPSTCCVIACKREVIQAIRKLINKPFEIVGEIV